MAYRPPHSDKISFKMKMKKYWAIVDKETGWILGYYRYKATALEEMKKFKRDFYYLNLELKEVEGDDNHPIKS